MLLIKIYFSMLLSQHVNKKMRLTLVLEKSTFSSISCSSTMRFRNKAIAHNESSPRVDWVEIDEDIKLLCRIWSLISMWSSIGITEPFRPSQQAFSGLDSIFTPLEIRALSEQHNIYIEKVESWCTHSLVDNSKVSKRSPFRKISVSTEVH